MILLNHRLILDPAVMLVLELAPAMFAQAEHFGEGK